MKITKTPLYLGAVAVTLFGYAGVNQVNASEGHEQAPAPQSTEQKHDTQDSAKIFKKIESLKWLQHTESKYICMVNNKRFDKVQIPTDVDGKTYYGCCSMCKEKLEKIQSMREATDPVSGNAVDKATAVIGTAPDRTTYYFENEENLKQFDKLKSEGQ